MVPHGDRSKVAIEPYLTDQWFVDAKTLAAAGDQGGEGRARPHFVAEELGKNLFPVAGEHRALVRVAPALVGPSDPGLVRAGRNHELLRGVGEPRRWPPLRKHYGKKTER